MFAACDPDAYDHSMAVIRELHVAGPADGVQLLFDDDASSSGLGLHDAFRRVYGGQWRLPDATDRPYTTINFVVSRDGRISYGEPGEVGGASVNNGCHADVWMMGLFRARCDAVMVGDGTVRAEPEHVWTPSYLGGPDAEAFEALRAIEGRTPTALHVFCSLTGEIDRSWSAVADESIPVVIATTTTGRDVALKALDGRADTEVVAFGDDRVDTAALGRWLLAERGVRSLLCEGGPTLYGNMVADGAVDEEFVTLSPVIVGAHTTTGNRRPSLVEGVSFMPGQSPQAKPISLRRSGDHLMLRSRLHHAS
jgi:riboflavin biosynthesis pyrimidine reductase